MSKSLIGWLHQVELKISSPYQKYEPVENQQSVTVKNGENRYNITHFLSIHPGGSKVLLRSSEKDVQKQMRGIPHRHSKMAYSLLEEYRIEDNARLEDTALTQEEEIAREKNELESKVDWSKGMLRQVGGLGQDYERWLDFPVTRRMVLLDSPWAERLTRTPWYIIPLVWCPVVLLFLAVSMQHFGRSLGVWALPGFLSGIVLWSLLEYTLHRFLFHMTPPLSSPFMITLHFLLHGIHHKIPFDKDRLVFPPIAAAVIATPITLTVITVIPGGLGYLVMAGVFAGYIMYDMCHYYLHHGHPNATSYFHHLKRHHAHHHFMHHNKGFGITSKIWDSYFGTELPMKS